MTGVRRFFDDSSKDRIFENIIAIRCKLKRGTVNRSILDDCELRQCTLNNCIITSNDWGSSIDCEFNNCQIRGTKRYPIILYLGEFKNCRIEYGEDEERSMKDRKPKDLDAAQFATYETMNNVVLTEKTIDYLRRYAWRTKRRLRTKKLYLAAMREELIAESQLEQSDSEESSVDQRNMEIENADWVDATLPVSGVPLDTGDDDILTSWSAKKAGKRPIHVSDYYFVDDQLLVPWIRMRLDVPEELELSEAEIYGTETSDSHEMPNVMEE